MEAGVLADSMGASLAHVQQIKCDDLAVILPTIAVMRSKRDALRKVLALHWGSRQGSRKYLVQSDAPKFCASGSSRRHSLKNRQLVEVRGVEDWGRREL